MSTKIYRLNLNKIQIEINARESIANGECVDCHYKNVECGCAKRNHLRDINLKYVATNDLYQMRLQWRESNNPNDDGYWVNHCVEMVKNPSGKYQQINLAEYYYFTFESGRLIKQLTSRSYDKNAYDEYVAEINEPNVYDGTYSEL